MTRETFCKDEMVLEVGEGLEPEQEEDDNIKFRRRISIADLEHPIGRKDALPSDQTHEQLDVGCYRVTKHPGAE